MMKSSDRAYAFERALTNVLRTRNQRVKLATELRKAEEREMAALNELKRLDVLYK